MTNAVALQRYGINCDRKNLYNTGTKWRNRDIKIASVNNSCWLVSQFLFECLEASAVNNERRIFCQKN